MSITAYKVDAVGHDRTGRDFGYVNIMYRYGGKQSCPRQQGGRLYTDMADGLLELWGFYPPGDRPAADGCLHRPEAQGTGVV